MNRYQRDDGSPIRLAISLVLIAVSVFVLYESTQFGEMAEQKPIDSCIDGIVMSFDGEEWHPVYIRKTKRTIKCSPTGEIGKEFGW